MKINMVVERGVNEDGVVPMARHFRGSGHVARFIEFMDVGDSDGWRMDGVVPAAEIVAMIDAATCSRRQEHLVSLASVEDDATGEELDVIWELEPGAQAIDRPELPRVDVARIEEALANLTQGDRIARAPTCAGPLSHRMGCAIVEAAWHSRIASARSFDEPLWEAAFHEAQAPRRSTDRAGNRAGGDHRGWHPAA
jgi:hypothetical protein